MGRSSTPATSIPPGLRSWQWKDAMAEGKADSALLSPSFLSPRPPHMTPVYELGLFFTQNWSVLGYVFCRMYAQMLSFISKRAVSIRWFAISCRTERACWCSLCPFLSQLLFRGYTGRLEWKMTQRPQRYGFDLAIHCRGGVSVRKRWRNKKKGSYKMPPSSHCTVITNAVLSVLFGLLSMEVSPPQVTNMYQTILTLEEDCLAVPREIRWWLKLTYMKL